MPAGELFLETDGGSSTEKAHAQLFAQLNLGEDVTKGLKKVTADMQTHKNPTLRAGAAPVKSSAAGKSESAQSFAKVDKPPRKELEGKKWMVEYQKNQPSLVISETEMNQVVYIFKCEGSTVQVKGIVVDLAT